MNRLALVLALLCLAVVSPAQTVKQGGVDAVPTAFHSPMVIETIFAPANPALWVSDDWTPQKQKPWKKGEFTIPEYHDLGKFTCDGLSIQSGYSRRKDTWEPGLSMELRKLAEGKIEVTVHARITNPGPVHDKMVTLFLEVLNGDELLAKTSIVIKVKANWRGSVEDNGEERKLILAADAMKPATKLRITMTTMDY